MDAVGSHAASLGDVLEKQADSAVPGEVSLEDMLAGLDLGQYATEHSADAGIGVARPRQQPDKPRM